MSAPPPSCARSSSTSRRQGVAVLVVSDELDELFEITDRLHVMFRGSLSPAVATRQTTRDAVGLAMAGSFEALGQGAGARQAAHA